VLAKYSYSTKPTAAQPAREPPAAVTLISREVEPDYPRQGCESAEVLQSKVLREAQPRRREGIRLTRCACGAVVPGVPAWGARAGCGLGPRSPAASRNRQTRPPAGEGNVTHGHGVRFQTESTGALSGSAQERYRGLPRGPRGRACGVGLAARRHRRHSPELVLHPVQYGMVWMNALQPACGLHAHSEPPLRGAPLPPALPAHCP
jgi:hypothetical protein